MLAGAAGPAAAKPGFDVQAYMAQLRQAGKVPQQTNAAAAAAAAAARALQPALAHAQGARAAAAAGAAAAGTAEDEALNDFDMAAVRHLRMALPLLPAPGCVGMHYLNGHVMHGHAAAAGASTGPRPCLLNSAPTSLQGTDEVEEDDTYSMYVAQHIRDMHPTIMGHPGECHKGRQAAWAARAPCTQLGPVACVAHSLSNNVACGPNALHPLCRQASPTLI